MSDEWKRVADEPPVVPLNPEVEESYLDSLDGEDDEEDREADCGRWVNGRLSRQCSLAQCSNGLVARAAYAAACELRPKAWIRVSDRARVIAEQNAPKDARG